MKSVLRVAVVGLVGAGSIVAAGTTPARAAGPVGWTLQFGGSGTEYADAVATTSKNEVVVVGHTEGAGLVGSVSGSAAFVAKFDKDGKQKWIVQLGNSGSTEFTGVAAAGNGDIYATGATDVAVAGLTKTGSDNDALLVKYDKNGNLKWARHLVTPEDDYANGVAVKGSAIYVGGATKGDLAGTSHGDYDGFLARFDTKGNQKFLTQFGTSGYEEVSGPAVSANGKTVVVSGYTLGTFPDEAAVTGTDAVVVAFNDKGVEQWHHQWGNWSDEETALGVSIGSNGLAYVPSSANPLVGNASVQVHAYNVSTGALQYSTEYDFGIGGTNAVLTALTKKNELVIGTCASGALSGQSYVGATDGGYVKFPTDLVAAPSTRQAGTAGADCAGSFGPSVAMMPNGSLVLAGGTNGSLFGFTNQGGYDVWMAVFPKP